MILQIIINSTGASVLNQYVASLLTDEIEGNKLPVI